MSQPSLRRSPRLAEKAAAAALQPVIAVVPPPRPAPAPLLPTAKAPPKAKPAPLEPKYSPVIRADTSVRKSLLEEAKLIRHQLGQARAKEDFAECSKAADQLWRKATTKLQNWGSDEMFLSDVCHWINWGKNNPLGKVEHKYAIHAIKSYVKCLEERIDDPYAKEYEDL